MNSKTISEMPTFKEPNDYPGGRYHGQKPDQQSSGFGSCEWPNGRHYRGEFSNGKFHGWGTYTWPNLRKYVGEWKDGVMDGRGTLILANGGLYEGQWRNGRREGFGTAILSDGAKYVGEWKAGKKDGHGSLMDTNGDEYIGEWRGDLRIGEGVFRRQDGSRYVGSVMDDPHGAGTLLDSSGAIFQGNFVNGRHEGQCRAMFPTGLHYDGEWHNGKKHGRGRWSRIDDAGVGYEFVGEWFEDEMHGTGSLTSTFADGKKMTYAGEWHKGHMDGEGSIEFTLETGAHHRYVGGWKKGKRHGRGSYTIIQADGEKTVYEGDWADGVFLSTQEAPNQQAPASVSRGSETRIVPARNKPLRAPFLAEDYSKVSNVDLYGWHVVQIFDGEPPFVFSIGLYHSFGHPEIMIQGLPIEVAGRLVNGIGAQIERGERFADGGVVHGVAEGFPLGFKKMTQEAYDEYLGSAIWFYESSDFPTLQCFWPDQESRFPWEEECDEGCRDLQELRVETVEEMDTGVTAND